MIGNFLESIRRMCGGILASILAISVSAGAVADPRDAYCPEREFAEICLAGGDKLENIRDRLAATGWTVSSPTETQITRRLRISRAPHERFEILENRYSDTTVLVCRYDPLWGLHIDRPMQCDKEFRWIKNALPANAAHDHRMAGGLDEYRWQHEQGRRHVIVNVSVSNSKPPMSYFQTREIVTPTLP